MSTQSTDGVQGFDPARSCIHEDTIALFVDAPVQPDLTSVPGIGPASADKLATGDDEAERVGTTYQLLGKFLSFFGEGIDAQQACDGMWYWLESKKACGGHRSGTVLSLADKLNTMVPGLCDFEHDDDPCTDE